ncbi:GDSL-type esterase/lipase family protein [Arenibacter sp. GZD96]|uniref:GDSL-type esterase/lipase family protein n=1 Tax=Aurantibrevibacter litoralis TaxID=3106030 RepID=UPI002AFEEBE9|nr:GDSL-type esterase/lipase family protein [Arenibacter sp. GZD-96]MEA1787423.1 GDSL-type esterase/lipase family protein [Arenibacter sp. GZD-96]
MKLLFLFLWIPLTVQSQNALRFQEEVNAIYKKYETLHEPETGTIVFTGSSSIRLWNDLEQRFPDAHIVNTGFGGSEASDLLAYSEPLILRYKPKKVFIYEGDNDIANKKRVNVVLTDFQKIIATIHQHNPNTQIVLLSAKPSPSRWHLRRRYKRLNRKIETLAQRHSAVAYANIWDVMLENGRPKAFLFTQDNLHMNAQGYDLWYSVIKNYIN